VRGQSQRNLVPDEIRFGLDTRVRRFMCPGPIIPNANPLISNENQADVTMLQRIVGSRLEVGPVLDYISVQKYFSNTGSLTETLGQPTRDVLSIASPVTDEYIHGMNLLEQSH
jgi:hypothetical protein